MGKIHFKNRCVIEEWISIFVSVVVFHSIGGSFMKEGLIRSNSIILPPKSIWIREVMNSRFRKDSCYKKI